MAWTARTLYRLITAATFSLTLLPVKSVFLDSEPPGVWVIRDTISASHGPKTSAPNDQAIQNDRVSRFVGMTVENGDGRPLGEVKDFIIDFQSVQVGYAILSTGGFLGIGCQLKLVPAKAISVATIKKGILALDISTARWQKAPKFRSADLAELVRSDYARRIDDYYRVAQTGRSALAEAHGTSTNRGNLTSTGRDTDTPLAAPLPRQFSSLQLATTLLGTRVTNAQRRAIGIVSDLLLDLAGRKPVFAVVCAQKFLAHPERFAVPLSCITPTAAYSLVLEADPRTFQHAATFSDRAWEGAGHNPQIYRYPDIRTHHSRISGAAQDTPAILAFRISEGHAQSAPKQNCKEGVNYGKNRFIGESAAARNQRPVSCRTTTR